jgi:plasmid stabilization system protein ParE
LHVRYRDEAAADLAEAHAWYEDRRSELGDEFAAEVHTLSELIARHPDAFPVVHKEVRRALLPRFPYALYYRRLDDEHLELLACLHQRQRLRRWSESR